MAAMKDGAGTYGSKTRKAKGSKPPVSKKKPAAKLYDWGDGRKVHSVPKPKSSKPAAPPVNEYGVDPRMPLTAPLNTQQAYGIANATADRVYAPQLDANRQAQVNVPLWYQGYIQASKGQQEAAQQYAQPLLATAQQGVTNAAATAPGLDPSSPQYAKEQEAAKGRAALAQLGASTLAAIPTATNAAFAGYQNTAARELPQVQAGLLQQYGQLGSQRNAAAADEFGKLRTGEQNYGIAQSTLGLNTSKAAADVDLARGVDPVTGEPIAPDAPTGYGPGGPKLNSYGYTYDEWKKLPESKRSKARAGKGKGSSDAAAKKKEREKKAAAEKKRVEGVRSATGTLKTKVTDAQAAWERYAKARAPKTQLSPDGTTVPVLKNGKPVMVGATPDQIKARLRKDGYSETQIHVMLMIRAGKPLTPEDVRRLKAENPNVRIPREWLRPKSTEPGNTSRGTRPNKPYYGPGR